jgi:hypothetical protein
VIETARYASSHAFTESRAIGVCESDQIQPQDRYNFAFQLPKKPPWLAPTARLAASHGESSKLLIPCNLRKRRGLPP